MAGVRGRRKAMLLIGEGIDYNIYEATGVLGSTASSVLLDTQDAIAAATRGNVSIYAIDPRGLTTGDEDLITQSSTIGDADGRALQNELRLSGQLARAGFEHRRIVAVNRNDLNGAFDRIVAENSSYYVFGYYSTNERRDGRFRKIEVRVKRPGSAQPQPVTSEGAHAPEYDAVEQGQPGAGRGHRQPAADERRADEGVCCAL